MKNLLLKLLVCLVGLGLVLPATAPARGQAMLVFAAASTTNAVTEAARAFEDKTGIKVTASFASSSTLAKQIAQGAPADVFLSANQKWMDYLAGKQAVDPISRYNLLRNRLVLIVPAASAVKKVEISAETDLAALLGADGRLALGDPAHVPAGIYAAQALKSLGLWPQVADRLAATANVRAALALVERAEAPLGAVYATDAAISAKVRQVGLFPLSGHKPILYPVARIKSAAHPAVMKFLEFLRSAQAKAIFNHYGFQTF